MNQVEAKAALVETWLKRPTSQRREMHIEMFYDELIKTRSYLLSFQGSEGRYLRIKTWLLPHVIE